MSDLRFAWLYESVLDEIHIESQKVFPLETGGILIGYWGSRGNTLQPVVTQVIGPGPRARHSQNRFSPDYDYQEIEVAKRYASSGRVETYLGDWHTHPNGSPNLSWTDKRTLKRIAKNPSNRATIPLMLVVGGDLNDPLPLLSAARWTERKWPLSKWEILEVPIKIIQ